MNERAKPGRGRPKKLSKTDADYYAVVGSKGGLATKKNHPKSYFSKLAKLSHLNRHKPEAPPSS